MSPSYSVHLLFNVEDYKLTTYHSATIWPALYRASAELYGMKEKDKPPFAHRMLASLIVLVLYVILTIVFGIRLHGWDPNTPGQCFEGNSFLRPYPEDGPDYRHNLAFTTLLVVVPFIFALFLSLGSITSSKSPSNNWNLAFLFGAIIQIFIHAGFFISLRHRDQHFLVASESESQWTFGQIIVMFSLLAIVFSSIGSYSQKV